MPHRITSSGIRTILPSADITRVSRAVRSHGTHGRKGRSRTPKDYLEDHFIDGNTFASFEEFLDRLHKFQEEVNSPRTRDHQATSSDALRRRALGAARVAALTIREPSRRGEEADHRLSCLIRRFALQRSALLCQAGCLAPHFQRIPTWDLLDGQLSATHSKEKLIRELASLHSLHDAKNILLLRPPGVGPP